MADAPPVQALAQHRRGEVRRQRLGPQCAQDALRIRHQPEPPELAGIAEDQPLWALSFWAGQAKPCPHVRIAGWLAAIRLHAQPAGHAQVADQRHARVQGEQQEFAPPAEAQDALARQRRSQRPGVRLGYGARPQHVGRDDLPAQQLRAQVIDGRFDFGKLGHRLRPCHWWVMAMTTFFGSGGPKLAAWPSAPLATSAHALP